MSATTVFGPGHASFYDHFYADKDYAGECNFLEEIMRRHAAKPVRAVLDMGCGTGGHALILAQRGYQVTGVDRSAAMLAIARAKAAAGSFASRPSFQQSDIRTLTLHRTFDVVIAMFAVMSYMVTNDDVTAALDSARRHLAPDGLLIFDAWFGPGVLTDPPTDRVKTIMTAQGRIVRMVHPETDLLSQTVRVHYHVLELHDTRLAREYRETHTLRFFFPQEIACLLARAGFRLQELCPFMAPGRSLTPRDWNMTVVARAAAPAASS